MSTISEITETLDRWTRRWRWQRAITWSLRGFSIGLFVILATALIGLYQANLLRNEFLILVISASLFFPFAAGAIAFLYPILPIRAARHFDLLFHLEERISTALELQQPQKNPIPQEMIQRQLEDAVAASKTVYIKRRLSLHVRLREVIPALVLITALGVLWFRGDDWFKASQLARDVEMEVAQQQADVEKMIEEINSNQALSDEQKQALTQPLQEAMQSLQENPSLENSVSVLTRTGEKLQSLSNPQSQQTQQALTQAGSEIAQQKNSPMQSVGNELAQGNYVSAASQLENIDLNNLNPAEQKQLADQLDELADSLSSTNPKLADELSQAANSIRSGDMTTAQQALSNAAKSLSQAGQQITFSQMASQSAAQIQNGAREVLAAGGSQQTASTGQGHTPGEGSSNSGGSGSGSGNDAGNPQSGDEAGSSPIPQDNGPGDGGETAYEQIYAPSLLGGEGGPDVNLPNSGNGEGDVIGQGPVTPGNPGSSLVPYSEVYAEYEQINNQAIENGEIPPQFIQIIKNYFDSLKP